MVGNLVYDTNALIRVVPNLKLASSFLLDKFFPGMYMSDTEYVSIDLVVGKRRMTPFVSPLVEGKLVEQLRMQTNTFKPPYLKDKRAPDLRRPVRRMAGERIGGSFTGAEREEANLAAELTDQMDMLTRRMEWMAANALATGTITVAGDGFPTTVLDFGRNSSLTQALTGSNVWGYAANFNADGRDPVPTANIETWQHNILKQSGAVVTDIIFTTTPWAKFLMAEGVQGAIYYPGFGKTDNLINPGAEIKRGGVYKGRWGQYDLWLYNEWYVDENTNIETMMIPDGTVILSGPELEGTRAFGQIIDPDFNYEALPYAPKTWTEKDPGQRLLLMQSAPIVIPARANASMGVIVCAGVVT